MEHLGDQGVKLAQRLLNVGLWLVGILYHIE